MRDPAPCNAAEALSNPLPRKHQSSAPTRSVRPPACRPAEEAADASSKSPEQLAADSQSSVLKQLMQILSKVNKQDVQQVGGQRVQGRRVGSSPVE